VHGAEQQQVVGPIGIQKVDLSATTHAAPAALSLTTLPPILPIHAELQDMLSQLRCWSPAHPRQHERMQAPTAGAEHHRTQHQPVRKSPAPLYSSTHCIADGPTSAALQRTHTSPCAKQLNIQGCASASRVQRADEAAAAF
jgi:hypothetical protein